VGKFGKSHRGFAISHQKILYKSAWNRFTGLLEATQDLYLAEATVKMSFSLLVILFLFYGLF